MIEFATKENVWAFAGKEPTELALKIVNDQIETAVELATKWHEYTEFLTGADWKLISITRSADGRKHWGESDYMSFRFESETTPVVTQIIDVLESFVFSEQLIVSH